MITKTSVISAIILSLGSGCSSEKSPKPESVATQGASNPALEGKLVQSIGDTKIYLVDQGKKRWITSPDAFQKHGFRWDSVNRVSPEQLAALPEGDPIQ
jgi:hypothetical protein